MLKQWIAAAALCVFGLAHAATVDANKATPAELDQIKGIGPATAARIVEQRKTAPFKNWEDFIGRVQGIGPGNAAKMSGDGLTVNGQSYKAKTATPATAAKPANTPPAPAAKTPKPAA